MVKTIVIIIKIIVNKIVLSYNIEKSNLYLIDTLFYRNYNENNAIKLLQYTLNNVPLCLLS